MPKSTKFDFRAWRLEMGMTQEQAARLLGYASQQSYALARNGSPK